MFEERQYVLLQYPSKPSDKLSALYRGPMETLSWQSIVLISWRSETWRQTKSLQYMPVGYEFLGSPNWNVQRRARGSVGSGLGWVLRREYCCSWRKSSGKNPKNWKFKVRWVGYDPEEDSWLNGTAVKDLAAFDVYSKKHPELKLGWSRWDDRAMGEIFAEESTWCKGLWNSGYTVANLDFGH